VLLLGVLAAVVAGAVAKAALSAVLSPAALHVEIHAVAAYLAVLGNVYGIIVAFMLFVVWQQFTEVQTGLEREAAALEDLCRVATFFSEHEPATRVRLAARRYIRDTTGDEPGRLAEGRPSAAAQQSFAALEQAVRGVDVTGSKDAVVYEELLRASSRVMAARDARLSISTARIPATLWKLVFFASLMVVGGFLALGIHALWLSVPLVAAVAGTLAFVLGVLRDMDNPFRGVWNVSYAPLTTVSARLA